MVLEKLELGRMKALLAESWGRGGRTSLDGWHGDETGFILLVQLCNLAST